METFIKKQKGAFLSTVQLLHSSTDIMQVQAGQTKTDFSRSGSFQIVNNVLIGRKMIEM